MEKTSLLDYISSAVRNGKLPEGFSLPDEEGDIAFADGAQDGIAIYHGASEEISDEDYALMEEAIKAASDKEFEKAEGLFRQLGKKVRAVSLIDEMQQYILERKAELNGAGLHEYAIKTAFSTDDKECLKYALIILELFVTDKNESWKKDLRTLALSDEFTGFVVFLMRNWTNGNDEIFELVKKVHGWGRIHALEHLYPDSEEIRNFFLKDAIHNDVLPAYSALTCFEKSEMENVLKGSLTYEEFCGVRDIIEGLLDEGPIEGLSAIENKEEIILNFLEKAQKVLLLERDYEVIEQIDSYFEEEKNEAVISLCKKLLEKK